ncbi:MAG: DUF1571 domain-containing protein [Gemmataceae bacterium]
MRRLWLCLPLCLLAVPGPKERPQAASVYSASVQRGAGDDAALPNMAEMERLARVQPLAFVAQALRRYQREVHGYSLTFHKREFRHGKLQPLEIIHVHFREQPYSVYFHWQQGTQLADRVLYVEGENHGKLLAHPQSAVARLVVGSVVAKDPDSPEAQQSGRYTIKDFGLQKGALRTLNSWKYDRETHGLTVRYLGIQRLQEVGDRPCFVFRGDFQNPVRDDITVATIYFDVETWLQIGTVLQRRDGQLVGAYYFRDIRLNPDFDDQQFTAAALTAE